MTSGSSLLLLDQRDVEALLRPDDVLDAVREAFILHSDGRGRSFPVVRESLEGGAVFGIKSGDVQSRRLLGFKAAGFWPQNRIRTAEPHQATIVLIDPDTGRPICIIDGNAITATRTGAAGALGLKYLARPESSSVCVFGTGVQARSQLGFALTVMRGLRDIFYVTVDDKPDRGFEGHFAQTCSPMHTTDRSGSVAACDIVITATPGAGPLFSLADVRPGTHINCVGADTKGKRELPEGLLERVKLYVDDSVQARQLGETQWAVPQTPITELGDVISGQSPAQRGSSDITVFDLTGLALQDLAVAAMLHERAISSNRGTVLPWAW